MKPELKNLFKFQSNKKFKQAIIDLGSNSIRMLIYDNFKIYPIPVFNEKAVCKLGKNLDKSKKLNPDGIKSSLKVLNRFKEILDISDVQDLEIIATAAFREATDASEFLREIEKIFNKKPLASVASLKAAVAIISKSRTSEISKISLNLFKTFKELLIPSGFNFLDLSKFFPSLQTAFSLKTGIGEILKLSYMSILTEFDPRSIMACLDFLLD